MNQVKLTNRRMTRGVDVDASIRVRLVGEMSKQELYEAVREDLPECRFTAVETAIARLKRSGEVEGVFDEIARITGQKYRLVRK